MGNCCGKPSDDNFSGEGRQVGSTPPARPKQSGTSKKTTSTSGGRTLGGSASQELNSSSPREAAAKAAEVCTYEYKSTKRSKKTAEPKKMVATAWI